MKINLFCYINGKEKPFLTLAKSDASGMFVVQYVFDGCTSAGKWRNKETAEEIALEKIAHYLDIHTLYISLFKK